MDDDRHWLAKDVNNWENDAEYASMEGCLKDPKVVNDLVYVE